MDERRIETQWEFYEEEQMNGWKVHVFDEERHAYTLRLHGATGEIHTFFDFTGKRIPSHFLKSDLAVETLIDEWDALYSHSPDDSAAVYSGELEESLLPRQGAMPQREAMHCAAQLFCMMKSCGVEEIKMHVPYVEFTTSPMGSRWHIMLIKEDKEKADEEILSCVIHAGSGTLEQFKWKKSSPF